MSGDPAARDAALALIRQYGDDAEVIAVMRAAEVAAMGDARLVLTEDLIRATLRREKAALKEAKRPPGAERNLKPKLKLKPSANVKREAAVRGADEKPTGPDEGDSHGR